MKIKNIFIFLFSFFLITNFVFADDVNITQFPDSPKEGQEVSLKLQSDKYDLNIAKITWSVDGTEVDSGVGRKTLTLKTSQNGLGQVVLVKVEQEGYDDSSAQKVVVANTNFILYEGANSVVPLFYKGRRLPAKEGLVRAAFFSFKDGNIVGLGGNGNEDYVWKINDEEKQAISGQNKIINTIPANITDKTINIKVNKTNLDGSVNTSSVNVPLQSTEVLVYKTDEKKIIKNILSDTEIGKALTIMVEPFFFSATSKKDPSLQYTWKINNIEQKLNTPWSVLFTANSDNSIKINLDLINNKKISQDASSGFTFKTK